MSDWEPIAQDVTNYVTWPQLERELRRLNLPIQAVGDGILTADIDVTGSITMSGAGKILTDDGFPRLEISQTGITGFDAGGSAIGTLDFSSTFGGLTFSESFYLDSNKYFQARSDAGQTVAGDIITEVRFGRAGDLTDGESGVVWLVNEFLNPGSLDRVWNLHAAEQSGGTSKYFSLTYSDGVTSEYGVMRWSSDGQSQLYVGSAAIPSLSFLSDEDLGLYRVGADQLGISAGGSRVAEFDSTGLQVDSIRAATSPGLEMVLSNTYVGIRSGATWNTVTYSDRLEVRNGPVRVAAGSDSAPSLSFYGDNDTGFYWDSSGVVAYASNGTFKMLFGANVLRGAASTGSFWVPYAVGTAGAPSYAFYGASDTGMWYANSSPEQIGFSVGGTNRIVIGTSSLAGATDNAMGLGSASLRFVDVWAVDTSINSSDPRYKQDLGSLPIDPVQFVRDVQPRSWRWPGRNRMHFGFDTSNVKAAMDAQHADWGAYVDPEIAPGPEDKGKNMRDVAKGLRVGELVPVMWAALQAAWDEIDALKAHVGI